MALKLITLLRYYHYTLQDSCDCRIIQTICCSIYQKRGCCGGRSSLEKVLLFVVTLSLAAVIAACIAIAVVAQKAGKRIVSSVGSCHVSCTGYYSEVQCHLVERGEVWH